MKQMLLQKILASILSSIGMAIFCTITFFDFVDFWEVVLFGTIIFVLIYIVLGTPTSILLDFVLYKYLKTKSQFKTVLLIFTYIFGGVIVSILFFMVSERESLVRLFDREMIMFYGIGIVGSLLFLVIESLIKKLPYAKST